MKPRHPNCLLPALRGGDGVGLRGRSALQVNPMTAPRASVRISGVLARI